MGAALALGGLSESVVALDVGSFGCRRLLGVADSGEPGKAAGDKEAGERLSSLDQPKGGFDRPRRRERVRSWDILYRQKRCPCPLGAAWVERILCFGRVACLPVRRCRECFLIVPIRRFTHITLKTLKIHLRKRQPLCRTTTPKKQPLTSSKI